MTWDEFRTYQLKNKKVCWIIRNPVFDCRPKGTADNIDDYCYCCFSEALRETKVHSDNPQLGQVKQ
jgi:hypothetical protein